MESGDVLMSRNRKTHRDHAKKTQRPMVEDEVIAAQLEALVTPAITAQENYYRQLGLRDRILNLPLMVAALLTKLWRDVAGVRELTRILSREGFLWCSPTQVSQQAVSQRFLSFPAELFERVFKELLPRLESAWHQRTQRLLPESLQFARDRFEHIWIADSSTLEALFRKLKSLEDIPKGQLAGKMAVVINLITRLPIEIRFKENPRASDTNFERGTWLFYGVLVDLGDAVADEMSEPFERISLEMIYRGLYHFQVAYQKGLATDPVSYFAAPQNQDLGIVKARRKPFIKLIIAPFPTATGTSSPFFFGPSSTTPLTTGFQP